MTTLRSPERDRVNRQMTVFTTLAPPWSVVAPFMWIWSARAVTGQGSWVDDCKANGGHVWSPSLSG